MSSRLPILVVLMLLPAAAGGGEGGLWAHWRFDEAVGSRLLDAGGHGRHATIDEPAGLRRVDGLDGDALELAGRHRLRVEGDLPLESLAAVSFSVWVRPTGFDAYNEIFRKEDGQQRVLFAFQHHGKLLALGLNVGGYLECDAAVDPASFTGGQWRHCAATFDGRAMVVYVDGREVGRAQRPGKLLAGGPAPALIGSTSGGEYFRGAMDDLRIYARGLTATEVQGLYFDGLAKLERRGGAPAAAVESVYRRGDSFAATLVATAARLEKQTLSRRLAEQLGVLLRRDFPQPYARFAEIAQAEPLEYVAGGAGFRQAQTLRLKRLLLEYKPLTPRQWATVSAAQRREWERIDALVADGQRRAAEGEPAAARWIEWFLAAGGQIAFRPYREEAVAPYVPPETPPTRDRTAAEAAELLRRDWLFQAGGAANAKCVADEIGWTRRLAARLAAAGGDVAGPLAGLKKIEGRLTEKADAAALYLEVRRLKRSIVLANPLLDFGRLLLVDMPFPRGKEWNHETRHRLGYMAVPGGRLLVVDGLSPDAKVRQLAPVEPLHGSFWRPDVSWDGRRVLFCFKPHNEKSFHLYEVSADGGEPRQLTDGPYDDLDPIYLPDEGHIVFSTTRGHTYVRCMPPTNAFVLARADRDGRNIYLLSQNNEPDYLPSVLHDGRLIYTRWEYTDKPVWRMQKLWTVNPDGAQVYTFWGNQSVWPDLMKDARAIPGSRRVMFTGSAHHDWFAGSVGIVDPEQGYNFPHGLTKVTADVVWPECGNGPVDPIESPAYHRSGAYTAYYSPYPLGERDFLVSANRQGKFNLYWMDVEGNRELLYEGAHNILHAMPLAPRPRPPRIAEQVVWPERAAQSAPPPGMLYSGSVFQNAPAVVRERARYLRVMHIDPKTYTYWHKRPYVSTGPVVSAVQSEGVKRLLGTVPLEADGSVAFEAPPGKALHFQLLDAEGMALLTMRSFTGVMPGERRGCLGCHESHSRSPATAAALALKRPPRPIDPPPWSDTTVSFARYVQPVLDRYCVGCHRAGEQGTAPLLESQPASHGFTEPYLLLLGQPTWGKPYVRLADPPPGYGWADVMLVEGYSTVDPAAYGTAPPLVGLSSSSRLVELCRSGQHHGVKVDRQGLARVAAWVDAIGPFSGDEEVRAIDDPVFQGVDWLAVRPRIKSAPVIARPGPVD